MAEALFKTCEKGNITREEMQEEDKRERELLEELMKLPDFDRMPLPQHFYKKYNLPPPKILGIMEALKVKNYCDGMPGDGRPIEIRQPAPGGLREIIAAEPLKIECVQSDETSENKESEGQNS